MPIDFTWEYLLEAYKAGTITDEEIEVMIVMMDGSPEKRNLFNETTNFEEKIKESLTMGQFDIEKALEKLNKKLNLQ